MHRYIKPFYLLALISCLFYGVFGQAPSSPAYSESVMYEPREFTGSRPKKQAKENTTPATVEQGPITIPVSLLDSSANPVTGLEKRNFGVFVDGKKAEISSVEKLNGPLNFVFLVEASPSSRASFKSRQDAISSIVARLGQNDKVSIIKFDSDPAVICELTANRAEIREAIENIKPAAGTLLPSLYGAVRFFFEKRLPKIAGRTVLFVLSDGIDKTSTRDTFTSSLEWAEKSDAVIIPIYFDTMRRDLRDPGSATNRWVNGGISGSIASEILEKTQKQNERVQSAFELGKLYLSDLVFVSGGRAVPAASFDNSAGETAANLIAGIGRSYLITFKPGEPGIPGQRKKLLVRADRPGLSVLARGSYIVKDK